MMLFPLLAAAAVAAAPSSPKPIDLSSWFSQSDYPVEALRKGIQGNARFEVDVGTDGLPKACRIIESSGSSVLDEVTCAVVLARARFKPAIGADGRPVPGQYRKMTAWRIPTPARPFRPGPFHVAVILDFTKDPDRPLCRVVSSNSTITTDGLSCKEAVQEATAGNVGAQVTKLTYLIATAPGDKAPYGGEPDWGTRVSFASSDQYFANSPYPVACRKVTTEGAAEGIDPCAGFTDPGSGDEPIPKDASRQRTEISVFAVRRQSVAAAASCEEGESAAEARSCQ